jgi:hypothetical protein
MLKIESSIFLMMTQWSADGVHAFILCTFCKDRLRRKQWHNFYMNKQAYLYKLFDAEVWAIL